MTPSLPVRTVLRLAGNTCNSFLGRPPRPPASLRLIQLCTCPQPQCLPARSPLRAHRDRGSGGNPQGKEKEKHTYGYRREMKTRDRVGTRLQHAAQSRRTDGLGRGITSRQEIGGQTMLCSRKLIVESVPTQAVESRRRSHTMLLFCRGTTPSLTHRPQLPIMLASIMSVESRSPTTAIWSGLVTPASGWARK